MEEFGSDEERHREIREDELWHGCWLIAGVILAAIAIVTILIKLL